MFTAATRAVGFLFRIFLSHALGPEMLGVYQIAMSFFMVFLTIIATGLPLAISKEVAKARESGHNRDIGKIATAGLVISLTVSIALCISVFILREFVGSIFTDERCLKILLILLPSIIVCAIYTSLRAVWWGEKKFFLLGATELFEQVIRVLFFAILIGLAFMGMDSAGMAALSFTIACVVSACAVVWIFMRQGNKERNKIKDQTQDSTQYTVYSSRHNTLNTPSASTSPKMLLNSDKVSGLNERKVNFKRFYTPIIRSATPITGVRAIASITVMIISIIIPARLIASGATPTQAIAEYGIIMGMTIPLLMIPSTIIGALATALVPELTGSHQRKDHIAVSNQISNAVKFTLFITFLILPAFIALGKSIGIFVYDNALSGTFLSMTAWVMIPLSLNQITNAILNSLGAELRAMRHYIIGSVALFIIVWFGPAHIGASALAVGMGACMLIASILNLVLISKLTSTKSNTLKMTAFFITMSIPAVLITTFMFGTLKHFFPLIINLGIAGTLSVAVILLLTKIFGVINFNDIKLSSRKS